MNPTTFKIGTLTYELMNELPHLPQGQRELVAAIELKSEWNVREIVEHLALKSPAPLWSRVRHLIEKGLVRDLNPIIV